MIRKILDFYRRLVDLYYLNIVKKPRIYFYPIKHLEVYPMNLSDEGINTYRKIRFFNFEILDFIKKALVKF